MKNNSESSQLVTSHNWSQASHSFEAFLGFFSKHLCTFRKKEATKVEGQFVGLIFHGELSIIKLMTLSLNTNLKKLFYSIRKFTSSSSSFSFGSCRVSALLWFRDGWFSLSCLDSKAMTTVKKGHQDCWERRKRPTVFKDKRCEASKSSIQRSFAPRKAVGWKRTFHRRVAASASASASVLSEPLLSQNVDCEFYSEVEVKMRWRTFCLLWLTCCFEMSRWL